MCAAGEPITLVSAEGFEFVVSRRAAECSKLIREMISSAPEAAPMNRLDFEMISPQVMEMICQVPASLSLALLCSRG